MRLRAAKFFWLAGIALLAIPFYRALFFTDRAYFFRDLARDILPAKTLLANALRAGEGIPYWTSHAMGGLPYYAMNVASPLHPLNFIFVAFPPGQEARALVFFIWAHFALLFTGAYILLRDRGLTAIPATLFAVGLTTNGYLMGAHSLVHTLGSAAAVPWWLWALRRYRHNQKLSHLLIASIGVAWPIYAGDPQFTYVMAVLSLPALWRGNIAKALRAYAALGTSSLAASAAQLLPTIQAALNSQRLGGLSPEELSSFSFHPLRLLETIFPLFFGNRFGPEDFWAEELVNFPYKTPFVFSTYLGILVLLLLTLPSPNRSLAPRRKQWMQYALVAVGFVFCFGIYSPLPLFSWAAKLVPGFAFFRYPERLLFWPLFGLWWIATDRWLVFEKTDTRQPLSNRRYLPLFAFIGLCGVAFLSIRQEWIDIPAASAPSIFSTALLLSTGALAIWIYRRGKISPAILFSVLTLITAADLLRNQSRLAWDQGIHVADPHRYELVREVKQDLTQRADEISHGASRRFSSTAFAPFQFKNSLMDHTSATTFASFNNLLPNVATYFGIEDVQAYLSFLPRQKIEFFERMARRGSYGIDSRFFNDLMGAYYVPDRDRDQLIRMQKNSSAQPYIFVAPVAVGVASTEEAYVALLKEDFRANLDLVVSPAPITREQRSLETGVVTISRRDGRGVNFTYTAPADAPPRYLTINESHDPSWQATINGENTPILLANAWAMAIRLPESKVGDSLQITLRYRNPLIPLGQAVTAVFFLFFAFVTIRARPNAAA